MPISDPLQLLTQALFLLIFSAVVVQALRRPLRATRDSALLFGAISLLIALDWAHALLRFTLSPLLAATTSAIIMAVPYLLLRLVADVAVVTRLVQRLTVGGLVAAIVGLYVSAPSARPHWLTLLLVCYFVAVTLYGAGAVMRVRRQATGVARRRMKAVAAGSLSLALALTLSGVQVALPGLAPWWHAMGALCALAAALGYCAGFAPPPWLRKAWQQPELRAFVARAAHLPYLADRLQIVENLERGIAATLGAPHALLFLWDEPTQRLRATLDGADYERRSGEMISGRTFVAQRAVFCADLRRDDPGHDDFYRILGARAVLAAPITAAERRLGVLTVYAARASIFAADDLALVQALAEQAAVVLQSHDLIQQAAAVQAREEATRLKDDFLAVAAHDLKTPLTAQMGLAQLLVLRAQRDPTAPADLPMLERLVESTQRMTRLVHDLLDVALLEQGLLVAARERVDLAALVRAACGQHATPSHPCRLEVADAIAARGDASRLGQVVNNLLENAIKYSPAGGTVQVRVWRTTSEAHLTVTDAGIGIPLDELGQLFERFRRGAHATGEPIAGTGLGLYICRGIVHAHGGHVWASSPGAGQGSTFHVVLPLDAGASSMVACDSGMAPCDSIMAAGAEARVSAGAKAEWPEEEPLHVMAASQQAPS